MWFPKHCVVLCVVTMEKFLINVSDKTCVKPLSKSYMIQAVLVLKMCCI